MFVDADTHVDENEETWSYFPKSMEHMKPGTMVFVDGQMPGYLRPGYDRIWFIDGQAYKRQTRDDVRTGTTVGSRELYDISERIKDMDEVGSEYHIMYPTLFIQEVSKRHELDKALTYSYNRWISDRAADSGGRLRWVAIPPLWNIEDGLKEIRWAKDAGAVGIYKRSFECGDRHPSSEYFFPVYELCQELELPICMHASQPWRPVNGILTAYQPDTQLSATQDAFHALVLNDTFAKFPNLNWVFVEAGSGWVPHVLWSTRAMRNRHLKTAEYVEATLREFDRTYLNEHNIFITCEVTEDLPYLIDQIGDDNLIVGSDYSHPDRSSVVGAHRFILDRKDIAPESAEKIVNTNGRRAYRLP
jgi:predicted TIM-barrel fold metal-dependent hydrolase